MGFFGLIWLTWKWSASRVHIREPLFALIAGRGRSVLDVEWNFYKVDSVSGAARAGIRPDPAHPGFQSFLIQPVVAGDLTFAEGQTESPYGTIRSRWEKQGGRYILEVTIPPNSQATVHLPAADASVVTESGAALADADGVTTLRSKAGHVVLRVEAGSYRFESK
jgi:hypothetical protein